MKSWKAAGTMERLFIALYLAGAAGLFANLLTSKAAGSDSGEGGSSTMFVVTWLVMYVIALPLATFRFKRNVYARELIALCFCLLVLAGYFWSAMPGQTIRVGLSLTMNILFAWYCSRRLSVLEFCSVLMWTLNVMVVIGTLLGLAGLPTAIYIDPLARANLLGTPLIQGLFSHKIYAGYYATIALVLNVTLLRGWRRYALSGLMLIGVALSGSSVGLAAAFIGLTAIFVIPRLRDPKSRVLGVSVGVFAVAGVTVFFQILSEGVITALGRDATLTGRTDIWNYAIQFWSEKPLFGWAYGGIFGDSPSAPGQIVRPNAWYVAPHFHDVYLQVAAELGTIGLLAYLYFVLTALLRTLGNAWATGRRADLASGAILVTNYAVGIVMNIGLRYNELSTLLLFFFFFAAPLARRSEVQSGRTRMHAAAPQTTVPT